MLLRYTGPTPSNVSRDAKYSVVSGDDGDAIRLIYRINARMYYLLTTSQHPVLVKIVNAAKIEVNGQPRGIFYINEFGDVLVPDGGGGSYWVWHYEKNLEFENNGGIVSPRAPDGLLPGATWHGPHVGVRYVLTADGRDVKYIAHLGNNLMCKVCLSDEIGIEAAARLASRLAHIMGTTGGRFYVNERGEMFSPGRADDGFSPIYLGHLDGDQWFSPPDGYERP